MAAISGASGMVYAKRLLEVLPKYYQQIYLSASDNALKIAEHELNINSIQDLLPKDSSAYNIFSPDDMFAPPASGSHNYDGIVVVPCSMGMLGRIAAGVSDDLITRAVDVCIKERRKVILVVRESPYSLIHLKNMMTLTQAGAIILPASPAFYNHPQNISDMVDFVVSRIITSLGFESEIIKGWGEDC